MTKTMCALALLAGCAATQPTDDHGQQSGETQGASGTTEPGGGNGGSGGAGSGSGSCSLGVGSYEAVLGRSNVTQVIDVALDRLGEAFAAGMVQDPSLTQISDVFEVSALGGVRPVLFAGSLVASDNAGNVVVAGTMAGNNDLFIAKIERNGRVIFVKQLDLCGIGLVGLAVAPDGRIAVSGTELGTAVLSPSGAVLFQLSAVGYVAFGSKGNLAIAGTTLAGAPVGASVTQMGDTLFVLKVDTGGRVLMTQSFTGTARWNGVVLDAEDHPVLVGTTTDRVSFDGTDVIARFAGEAGRVTGGFLVELDNAGIVLVRDLGIVEANGVAVDLDGNQLVAGAVTINTNPFRAIQLLSIDVRGVVHMIDTGLGVTNGRAFSIAADECGAIYAGVVHVTSPNVLIAVTQAEVLKISQ